MVYSARHHLSPARSILRSVFQRNALPASRSICFRDAQMTHTVYLTVVMLAVMAIYFLPALIADERKRPDTLMLALFNFALGWTLVGWAMALYWALQPVKQVDGAQLAITTRREKTEALFATK